MKKLIISFINAGRGIFDCAAREQNFRIHIVAAVTVLIFAVIYGVTKIEAAVLTLTVAMVLALEALNTAVENAVNLASSEKNEYARIAKDAAAGAVLISAICSLLVAFFIFGDMRRLVPAIRSVLRFWYFTVVYVIGAALFVFLAKHR